MYFSEMVINYEYGPINPVQFGHEACHDKHFYGPAVRTHWLLHYVISGKGYFTREGKTYEVSAGDIFVIPPFLETFYRADNNDPWEYIWIGFVTDKILPEILNHPIISCPGAGAIFEEMRLCRNFDNGKSAYLNACIWRLFAELLEHGKLKSDYVDKALNFIHTEFGTQITINEIADRLNLDRSYLTSIFKKRTGISPGKYLKNYRLEKAAELLTIYGEKPSVAANSVGFDDIFHFSKNFKAHFGVSPREYAKNYRK